jgi:AbrB family looped-hinge helix DNA binding protein
METIQTTRMSSKGQVVIPEEVRKSLGLSPGQQFVVIAEDDVVILKSIAVPSMRDFDKMISRARRAARQAGMRKTDISAAINTVRNR